MPQQRLSRIDFDQIMMQHVGSRKMHQKPPRSIRKALVKAKNGHDTQQKKAISKIVRWLG